MNEIEFLHAPTSVEARFDEDGRITPISFTREKERQRIQDVGRRWSDHTERGPTYHCLVMTAAEEVFQLSFYQGERRWEITRRYPRGHAV